MGTELGRLENDRPKAVAVAQDMLERIEVLRLQRGYYCKGRLKNMPTECTDLRGVADEVQEQCTVCMLGGLMLSKARLYDGVPLAPLFSKSSAYIPGDIFPSRQATVASLDDIFTRVQLDMIEAAFEVRNVFFSGVLNRTATVDQLYAAISFGKLVNADMGEVAARQRAEAVAHNIINNDGVFVPLGPPTILSYPTWRVKSSDIP